MRRSAFLIALLALPASSEEGFDLVGRNGEPAVVRATAGQPLLLHFWATWCAECADDLAHLAAASSACDRVEVIAVNAGDSQADIDAFLARHEIRLRVLRDPKGTVWRRLDARGLPMNAYWSATGQKTDLGPKTREQWRALLGSLGCPRAKTN